MRGVAGGVDGCMCGNGKAARASVRVAGMRRAFAADEVAAQPVHVEVPVLDGGFTALHLGHGGRRKGERSDAGRATKEILRASVRDVNAPPVDFLTVF